LKLAFYCFLRNHSIDAGAFDAYKTFSKSHAGQQPLNATHRCCFSIDYGHSLRMSSALQPARHLLLSLHLQIVLLLAAKRSVKVHFRYYIYLIAGLLLFQQATAQYTVQGTVLDSSRHYPLQAVTVQASNGAGTTTDTNGVYRLSVSAKDSVWFSYLGKPTRKFPVLKIADISQFDIALQVNVPVLPEVKIRPRNYKLDSLQNREDYAKIFNFRKPNLESMTSIGPGGAGIDIDELIRAFQFKKNKSTLRFQERLLQQERDKFIDHRFNKALVRRLTALDGDALDRFMVAFRPGFEFAAYTDDYTFQLYIKESAAKFKAGAATPTF